ncbi:MAG: arylesterase [Pyrinomonadaceae bacterium]
MKSFLLYLCFSLAGLGLVVSCGGGNQPAGASDSTRPAQSAPAAAAGGSGDAAASAAGRPRIVAFGDSLTAGLGLPAHQSYPALLEERLRRDGYSYEVVNAGVSGDTSTGGLSRIDWALAEGDVRFVILELGANDILRGQSVSQMKKNLAQLIDKAQARGARVILAGMYAPTSNGVIYQREVAEAFRSLAAEQEVTLMPFFLEGVAGQANLNLEDGIHPNPEGTRIVAENVYKVLKPLLEEKRAATMK